MNLDFLFVCRNLVDDPIIKSFDSLNSTTVSKLIEFAERNGCSGNLCRKYLIHSLIQQPNIVSTTIEKSNGYIGSSLMYAFVHDIEILLPLFNLNLGYFQIINNYHPTNPQPQFQINFNLNEDAESIAESFVNYYRQFGYGDIAKYRAFRWNDKLVGIDHFDPIQLDDLIGYEHQKQQLIENTEAFVNNKPANNVLLVGTRGTGKSSSVKALVNKYFNRGLRLLQLNRSQLKNLNEIINSLRNFASKKFIIFLDDLSFEESDSEYKFLKSSIEGGVESRPSNVLIYATSNRRHLIHESWNDRLDGQNELYREDSINETISLSDRFGLIVSYYPPSQDEYLKIIQHMLKKNNIELDNEQLRIEGLRWEMSHSGRNGRTAQQFVTHYLGQL